jgi:hypothetical protein
MGKRFPIYLLVVILILFIVGLYNLFSMRFRAGDIYPTYSSLRSDPLGTKVLFKGLAGLDGIKVERNFRSLSKFSGEKDTTFLVLGASRDWVEVQSLNAYQAFSGMAASGGRVVISLYPSQEVDKSDASTEAKAREKDKGEGTGKKEDKRDLQNKKPEESLFKRWGLTITNSKEQGAISADLKKNGVADLPPNIKCASTLYFTGLDKGWDVIYERRGLPVMIEKRFGAGSIVLYADSYIFSNEAMMSERRPGLLAWLAGRGVNICFDESHFGITRDAGIVDLMYKYRLQGVTLVLLLIAGLFLWKTAIHFVPPFNVGRIEETGLRTERDHLDGLTGLLQRNIQLKDLMDICVKEWEKSIAGDKLFYRDSIPKVRELIDEPGMHSDPVQSYNKISDHISERKRRL